jgi:chromate transporter
MEAPSYAKLFFSFLRLGAGAFGGPAMVAYIEEMAVNKFRWMDSKTFKDGVALCQAIPGATAMQVAAFVGLKTKGINGSLLSFAGFGLPAFILMLLLSALYVRFSNLQPAIGLFAGLKVVVVAIIVNATISFGKGCLKNYRDVAIASATTLFFWVGASPFLVIIGSGMAGVLLFKELGLEEYRKETSTMFHVKHGAILLSALLSAFLSLYLLDKRLFGIAALMLKVDLFAFGGGFASLPLLLNQVVDVRGWIDSKTFMDGVALGQVTPGPIVITATFIGYMVYGLPGAIVATLGIFTPSFLILVFSEPVFNKLDKSVLFKKAIRAILASFVGLIFYTAIKFGVSVPWDVMRVTLGMTAFIALLKRVDVLYVVLGASIISVVAIR